MTETLRETSGAAPDSEHLLRARNLHVQFRLSDKTVYAVNGVDLDLRAGEVLGIVGESGSGKSVSALAMMGLLSSPPATVSADQLELCGVDLLAATPRQLRKMRGDKVAMVFQDPMASLNPVIRIGTQLTESLRRNHGMGSGQARTRGLELLDMVGVPDAAGRLDDYPYQFSGGMLQRVMIAMSLSCGPKVLIADEPTTALDVTIQAQILRLLRRLQSEMDMSMIIISHDLGVIAGLADRVAVMYGGRVVETGDVYDVFGDPRHPYMAALLRSTPRLDQDTGTKLAPIPGTPPTMTALPTHCTFAARCAYASDDSWSEVPPLHEVGEGHFVACVRDFSPGELIQR